MRAALACALVLSAAAPARAANADDAYYYESVHEPFFREIPGQPGWMTPARSGARPAAFQNPKPAGVFRVFIVGGSTAGAYNGDGDLAWGLARALPADKKVEVINCGMSGYDSQRERLVLRDVLEQQPDAVVFLTGHNDFFMFPDPLPNRWALRAGRFLKRFAWFRSLQERLAPMVTVELMTSPEARGQRRARLLENVRKHARDVRRAGARAVFLLPPHEYVEMGPLNIRAPLEDARFAPGWAELVRGKGERAVAEWRLAEAQLGPEDDVLGSFVRGYAGRELARRGKWAEAKPLLEAALEGQAGSNICPASCLRAVEAAAKEEGALVVDGDAAFRAAAAPGLPDARLFVDEIHWHPGRAYLLTRPLVAALAADPALAGQPWTPRAADVGAPPRRDELERLHRDGLLFHAVQKTTLAPGPFPRVTEAFASARALDPERFASPGAFLAAAQAVADRYESRRPDLATTPLPKKQVPRERLLVYYGLERLEAGDCAAAAKVLSSPEAVRSDVGDRPLLLAAARAACGQREAASRDLAAAGDRWRTRALSEAFGLSRP